MNSVLDLTKTYLHLEHGQAEAMQVDERFWDDVISGARPLPGWLVATFDFPAASDGEGGFSEQHPHDDEVHTCVSGAMSAVLEYRDGDDVVEFSGADLRDSARNVASAGGSRTEPDHLVNVRQRNPASRGKQSASTWSSVRSA